MLVHKIYLSLFSEAELKNMGALGEGLQVMFIEIKKFIER